jgi:hypothetical protein
MKEWPAAYSDDKQENAPAVFPTFCLEAKVAKAARGLFSSGGGRKCCVSQQFIQGTGARKNE